MRVADEPVEILKRPEHRTDSRVVAHVEPLIQQWRAEERSDPHGGHPERLRQVVERRDQAA